MFFVLEAPNFNPPLVAPLVKSTEIGKQSHDGQKDRIQVLVARQAKAPFGRTTVTKDRFVIFGRGAPKMGKKCWRKTFGTIDVKVQVSPGKNWENLTHGRTSKRSNPGFGRTPVKSTIWSHADQKDRFVIFGLEAHKMGKQLWRETLGTIGVKVRSISSSKF